MGGGTIRRYPFEGQIVEFPRPWKAPIWRSTAATVYKRKLAQPGGVPPTEGGLSMTSVGIEIAKEFIDIATPNDSLRVKRTRNELRASLELLPKDSALVMEATGRYHRLVVEVARELGLQVRCVNPYVFSLYRKSVNPRAKTDRIDAKILQRFGEREWDRLRETEVMDARLQRLKDLLELRDTQVKLRTAWAQSMSEIVCGAGRARSRVGQVRGTEKAHQTRACIHTPAPLLRSELTTTHRRLQTLL